MTDKLNLTYFIYPALTLLPRDKRAYACWYFYTIAQKAKANIGDSIDDQILYEGNLWMDKRYEQQARAVATLYQLESPDEFAKFWNCVKDQAIELGLPEPSPEYMRPLKRFIVQ